MLAAVTAAVSEPGSTIGLSEALVGLPVAVVVVGLFLFGWKLLRDGTVVLGREYQQLQAERDREVAELGDDRDFWRSAAVRALNIGEAVADRRDAFREGR